MDLLRHTVDRLVVDAVLPAAPRQRLPVQIGHITEYPIDEKVLLYEADEPFDLAFRERMTRLAELRLKAHGLHERLIVRLPYRVALQIPTKYHAFHVVRQDILRNAHLNGALTHTTPLGSDIYGNLIRIDNLLDGMEQKIATYRTQMEEAQRQLAVAKEQVTKPFPQEDELKTKSAGRA